NRLRTKLARSQSTTNDSQPNAASRCSLAAVIPRFVPEGELSGLPEGRNCTHLPVTKFHTTFKCRSITFKSIGLAIFYGVKIRAVKWIPYRHAGSGFSPAGQSISARCADLLSDRFAAQVPILH